MAETEFISAGGLVRQTILSTDHGQTTTVLNGTPVSQWATIKPVSQVVATASSGPHATGHFYPATGTYEWKVEETPTAAATLTTQQATQIVAKKSKGRLSPLNSIHNAVTVAMDIKPLPQAIIAQCSNAWSSVNSNSTSDGGYQTIKWDAATPIQVVNAKANTTLNTAGLHFISAPPPAAVVTPSAAATPGAATNMVIHGGRKTAGTIIETFKCEVCNQIFSNMSALQTHVAHVHEVGLHKRGQGKKGFSSSTLHCEYKYSGLSLADSITSINPTAVAAASQQQPHLLNQSQLPTLIATGGPINGNASTATFIQAPSNLTITSIGNGTLTGTVQTATTSGNMASLASAASSSSSSAAGIVITKNGKIRKEKKRNWECVICHNRFSRKDHLAKHVSAVHEKIRPFECLQCSQKFSQKHHLRAHMLARHEDDKLAAKAFACQQCPKRFTRNDHLERHIESVHEKKKAFECQVCAHQFARKHHLSKHILAVHAKVKPYGCNQCDQSFLQRHHLGAHIMSVHQPPIHEEPDGSKSYVCAICSHRFKRKDHLKKHVETVHEKTRAYACMLCERRFGQKYHLAIHVSAVHEGKKPYSCNMCSHKSARKSGLQRHMRTVHNVKHPQILSQPLQQPLVTASSVSTADGLEQIKVETVTAPPQSQQTPTTPHHLSQQAVAYTVSTQ